MTPERWQQIERLFHAALERPAAERIPFLDDACRGDSELRSEVESLLVTRAETVPFLEGAAIEIAARDAARDAMQLAPGQRVGPFTISSRVGAGGMGEVWRARDSALGRDVAIKVLTALHSSDPERLRRFEQEARAAGQLNHPNILTVHAIGHHDGAPYLVTELLEGETLHERLSAGALSPRIAIDIAIQITRGLAAAHERGIVHRDLKPANIFMTTDGRAKILDFGLAKLTQADAATGDLDSTTGVVVGTAGYMAPEQIRGHAVDHRADLFSLGIVLYEMLAGRRAFAAASGVETMNQILTTEPAPIEHLDPELWHIVQHCLEKAPGARFQSARDLAFHLENVGGASDVRTISGTSRITSRMTGLLVLVALAIGSVALWRSRESVSPVRVGAPSAITSVAVLPLENLSDDPEQEYLSDGVAEELLNSLAKVPGLRVTARSSSFQFKGKRPDLRTIGRQLNVTSVLEGSVRKDGRRVRIRVQLVDARDGSQLWSASYERQLDDIFAVQEDIARSVAEALKVGFLGSATVAHAAHRDPDAYSAYLQGRYFYSRRRKEDLERAAGYYTVAIERDPKYAAAWAGLAEVHHRQADNGYLPINEGYEQARREVERALALDENLVLGHVEVAWIKRAHDWDWQGADAAYKRALALDPGNSAALTGAAVLAKDMGRLDEAIELNLRALSRDPLSISTYNNLGFHAYYAGQMEQATAALNKVIELNPDFPIVRVLLGRVLLAQGRNDAALAEMERERDPVWRLYGVCLAYRAAGRPKEADAALADLIRKHGTTMAFQVAEVFAHRGDADHAFEWLERAFELRDAGMADIKNDPVLKSLERDRRYLPLLSRMRLPF